MEQPRPLRLLSLGPVVELLLASQRLGTPFFGGYLPRLLRFRLALLPRCGLLLLALCPRLLGLLFPCWLWGFFAMASRSRILTSSVVTSCFLSAWRGGVTQWLI